MTTRLAQTRRGQDRRSYLHDAIFGKPAVAWRKRDLPIVVDAPTLTMAKNHIGLFTASRRFLEEPFDAGR